MLNRFWSLENSGCSICGFDNIELASNKIKKSEGRKTSREYLVGMMGIENGAVKDVANGLVLAGFKRAIAEKKARSFVGRVKRNCIVALHKLNKASKQSEIQPSLCKRW